jgi:hypothetical protein
VKQGHILLLFLFLSVPLSFLVFCIHLRVLCVCVTEEKKVKNGFIFHVVTVSNHISILKRKERDRD